MTTLWVKILSFLTGMGKLIELANDFFRRRKREKEIKEVKKETEDNKEIVKSGTIDDLNEKFGWKDK